MADRELLKILNSEYALWSDLTVFVRNQIISFTSSVFYCTRIDRSKRARLWEYSSRVLESTITSVVVLWKILFSARYYLQAGTSVYTRTNERDFSANVWSHQRFIENLIYNQRPKLKFNYQTDFKFLVHCNFRRSFWPLTQPVEREVLASPLQHPPLFPYLGTVIKHNTKI